MDKVYISQIKDLPFDLWIASIGKGLLSIGIGEEKETFLEEVKELYPEGAFAYDNKANRLYEEQLVAYFQGNRKDFDMPLYTIGTTFQKRVWEALLAIPYGKVVTYKDIALAIDNPKAVRAVGLANNRNKIPIVIPCHRVIGSNQKLVGYGGGLHIKEHLLTLEGIEIKGEKVVTG